MKSNGKGAIVTGGGSGIGKHSALALLRDGYSVTIAGRREDALKMVIEEAGEHGSRVLPVPTNVGDPSQVKALFLRTGDRFGRLDVLFNNAGVGAPGVPMEDLKFQDWMSVVDTNLTGTFLCTQEAMKIMKNQDPMGGRIINNGSISAHTPRPNSSPYTATKHAVAGLTKATALDGRKYNVACGQIDVGNAATDMTARMPKDGMPQAYGGVDLEPTFDAKHVAESVLYMANLPLDANILTLTIMATKMPYVGRG